MSRRANDYFKMSSFTAIALLTLMLYTFCTADNDSQKTMAHLVDAANKFSIKFFTDIISNVHSENLIVSPFSAWLALSMIAYGTAGKTFVQMKKSLFLPNENVNALTGFDQIINDLTSIRDIDCVIANKIYFANDLHVEPKFNHIISNVFKTSVSLIDKSHPQNASEEINKWVRDVTHGKIKNLIHQHEINFFFRMMLLDAVYFKGEWKKKFDVLQTTNKPFYTGIDLPLNKSHVKFIPTMTVTGNFFLGDLPDYGVQFIQIPYKSQDAVMTIIVPQGRTSLKEVVQRIGALNSTLFAKTAFNSQVALSLPKFKINSSLILNRAAIHLGMSDLFDSSKANFSNMSKERFKMNKIKQKAFIEVNEKGSEAAVATDVEIGFKSSLDTITAFDVNRPSLFLITVKNITIFMGRIGNPEY